MALPLLSAQRGTERGGGGLPQLTEAPARFESLGVKQRVVSTLLIPTYPADDHAATTGNTVGIVCLKG